MTARRDKEDNIVNIYDKEENIVNNFDKGDNIINNHDKEGTIVNKEDLYSSQVFLLLGPTTLSQGVFSQYYHCQQCLPAHYQAIARQDRAAIVS